MTSHASSAPALPADRPDIWDGQRLTRLLTDVGEPGLRDILRLFLADMPLLQQQFAAAAAAGDTRSARAILGVVQDSADSLGLAALGTSVRRLLDDPIAPGGADLLAREIARIRFVPTLQHAS